MTKNTKKNTNTITTVVALIAMAHFIIATVLFIQLLLMDILPDKYLIAYGVAAVLFFFATMFSTLKPKLAIVMAVLSVIIGAILIYGILFFHKLDSTVEETSDTSQESYILMDVLVLEDDAATSLSDIANYSVGYLEADQASEYVVDQIKTTLKTSPNFDTTETITNLASTLLDGTDGAIIMEDTYLDVISELDGYEDFADDVRILETFQIAESELESYEAENVDQAISSGEGTFVVYLSGIDTYGSVSTKSRSDVNILAIVNQNTGKIQLINTPRDAYVLLPMGSSSYDKLTHAGIYGIDVSMATLENLYGVDIDYYVRVNFTGFEDIIDALGGIDVDSEYSFTSKDGYSYASGTNHLYGAQALSFARERKAFSSGDLQRGKNQMAVIVGIIEKLQSAEMLTNYSSIMSSVSDCFQTNMSSDEIYDIVKQQLDDGTVWEISTYTTTGTGTKAYTYSVPNKRAYVLELDDASVEEAVELIKSCLDGE